MKKSFVTAFLLSSTLTTTIAAEHPDCYKDNELTAPMATNYIVLIDNFTHHGQEEKEKALTWLKQAKSNDTVSIYNYSYGINPEINTIFTGRNPNNAEFPISAQKNKENISEQEKEQNLTHEKEVKEDFEDCIKTSATSWDLDLSSTVSKAFYSDIDDDAQEYQDNLKKLRLFVKFLIPQDKNKNKILWISTLQQSSEAYSYSEDGNYSLISPQEDVLDLASKGEIPDKQYKNTSIQIHTGKNPQGKQKEAFQQVEAFWSMYFTSVGIQKEP